MVAPPTERALERRPARGLTLWSVAAVVLSPFAVPTFGVGPGLAVALLIACAVLHRRGYRVRGPMRAGVVALVLAAVSSGACYWTLLRPAEVTGREEVRQDRVEDRFDSAFDNATAPPPPRAATDGGIGGDDAGGNLGQDGGPLDD